MLCVTGYFTETCALETLYIYSRLRSLLLLNFSTFPIFFLEEKNLSFFFLLAYLLLRVGVGPTANSFLCNLFFFGIKFRKIFADLRLLCFATFWPSNANFCTDQFDKILKNAFYLLGACFVCYFSQAWRVFSWRFPGGRWHSAKGLVIRPLLGVQSSFRLPKAGASTHLREVVRHPLTITCSEFKHHAFSLVWRPHFRGCS